MEMEFIHRQEELEHAELERALRLSLAAEEERIRAMVSDMKLGPDEDYNMPAVTSSVTTADSKGVDAKAAAKDTPYTPVETTPVVDEQAESKPARSSPKKTASLKPVAPSAQYANLSANAALFAEVKPLKSRESKPLSLPLPSLQQDLQDKKRQTEAVVLQGARQLETQRANEVALKQQLTGGVDGEELARRSRHLQEQRDLLIAKKKAEREEKVRVEERKRKEDNPTAASPSPSSKKNNPFLDAKQQDNSNSSSGEEEELAEMRRATMRMALARRLKLDLLESEEAKMNALQESQYQALDRKLQQVEQLREDNRKREHIMQKQMERQQDQIARNIELSAAQMARQRDL